MRAPGKLLASGRDADIFECGPQLVLRRTRVGRSMAEEARAMTFAREQGYPVPAIDEVSDDGTELVMERVEGPLMVQVLERRPWTLARNAVLLANLHKRLHDIEAPEWLTPSEGAPGDRLLHLDLHPLNVIMTAEGPVVIDWSNARRGHALTDVALTWLLLASGEIPGGGLRVRAIGRFRALFVSRFVGQFDIDEVRRHLPGVTQWKLTDPHMSEREKQAMRRLAGDS